MSDEEDERSSEEEESEAEEEEQPREHTSEPTEAELALKKRRAAQEVDSKGLDEAAKELLQANKEERQAMEDEINELRKRNEQRKKEREAEEKRLASERVAEEEKRKAAEEDKRRKKEEEEDRKKKDRASKMAEFEKWKNPSKPNFVIAKRSESLEEGEGDSDEKAGVPKKSREQQEAEKKAILGQRIQALGAVDNLDAAKLAEKAKELHKTIYRLETEKYDYEKRFKAQQVDMMELAERARQANKVGRGGLKRIQVSSEDVDDIQSRFSGAPAKVEMYSKYERQKDKRAYKERKGCFEGPVFAAPTEKIRPSKSVKWTEEGLPLYEDLGEGGAPPPAEEVQEE